jgi:peptide/nickel transport system substrate-binding protein
MRRREFLIVLTARTQQPKRIPRIATEIQARVYDQVIYIPLGQWTIPSVWRKEISGVLDGPATPVFWNVEKTD